MSIYDDLDKINRDELNHISISNLLQDYGLLCTHLANCKQADEVLILLHSELLGQNRPSYINRIYGRYRKLLPYRDMTLIQQWRQDNA